jgi:ABC-type transport system substrate-binding protein
MVALAVVLTSMVAGVSCSSSSTESSGAGTSIAEAEPVRGGRLAFGVTAETNGWNPALDQWTVDSHLIASSFYEPLVAVGPDYNLVPQLAEVIDHNDDFTEWTLHLREGVTFHDGTPCDAEAVKANLDASRNGIGAFGLTIIESVEAVDPTTVVVTMNSPWSAFPGAIAGQAGYMAAPRTLADGSASTQPVGTGPYVFREWIPDRSLLVTKNENYWQPDLPYLDEIEYQPMIDNTTRGAALESGSIDMMLTVSAADASKFRDASGYNVLTDDTAEETHATLNFSKPPFDNELARRAIVHATDQAAVIESIGPGVLEAAEGPFAPGEPWHTSDSHYGGFDPEAAAREVAEYEAQTGQSLSFTLMTFPDDVSVRQAQLLQEMWTRVGAEPRLVSLEQSAFITRIVVGDFDAAISSNFGYADPDFNYIFWHSSTVAPPGEISINFLHNANPEVDGALNAARETIDVDARATQYQTVTQILNDDFSYVWLYRTPYTLVAQEEVGGLAAVGEAGFARADGKPWVAHLWLDRQ